MKKTNLNSYLLIFFALGIAGVFGFLAMSVYQTAPSQSHAIDNISFLQEKKKTVCLNMIVKNESLVIKRCLQSVMPLIDYWVIVDTGSTDNTQSIITDLLKDIPGELHEKPWKNFAHNRNEALKLAKNKGDYLLLIDADEMLEYSSNYVWPNLDKDQYDITMKFGNIQYSRVALIKSNLAWKWEGVLHEYLFASNSLSIGHLRDIFRTTKSDGDRSSDPEKYVKDAAVLESALLDEPGNVRYLFYLAQSYRDANQYELAIENYQKRAKAGGWNEEVYYSLLQIARLQFALDKDSKTIINAFLTAFTFRPSRAEALCDLAKYFNHLERFDEAYRIASLGMKVPYPNDILFVEPAPYQYDLALECSVAAYWLGKYDECRNLSHQLLLNPDLPTEVREVVENNLAFANSAIKKGDMQK